MAELLLKVKDQLNTEIGYKDGDILCAFNDLHISCVHAEHICHIKHTQFNSDGLNENGISRKYQEFTYQYKFERVSRSQVKRILLSDLSEEILGIEPNNNGEYMDVQLYIDRRIKHPLHKIYGTNGKEYWYGGRININNSVMDSVWNMIETETQYRRINFTLWPLQRDEKRFHLALRIDDFSKLEKEHYEESEFRYVDGKKEVIKKRMRNVEWRSLSLPESNRNIDDPTKEIDIRIQAVELKKAIDIRTKTISEIIR